MQIQTMPAVPMIRPAGQAAQQAPAGAVLTRADRAASIRTRMEEAQTRYYDEYRKRLEGKDTEKLKPEDWEAITKDLPAMPLEELGAEAKALILENDGDEAAFEALAWLMTNPCTAMQPGECERILAARHMDSPKLSDLLQPYSPVTPAFVREVIAKTKDVSVRCAAQVTLAGKLSEDLRVAEQIKTMSEADRTMYEGYLGRERIAAIGKLDPEAVKKEMVSLYETVERDAPKDSQAAKTAAGELYELRNLAVGMQAPEIEGPDLDGVAFKLSDYRGKVVLLDFWGNW